VQPPVPDGVSKIEPTVRSSQLNLLIRPTEVMPDRGQIKVESAITPF
jgi:hypothetical protein